MRISAVSVLKRSIFSFVILAFISAGIFAQDKPDEPIRIDTNLIQTDVTVMDKAGRFVDGLTRDQFVLKIDGKPVKIDFFERVVSYMDVNRAGKPEGGQKTPPETPPVSFNERKVVFFVDDFHLSLDSMGRTRSAITHFIDFDMMLRDQVMIITTSGNLGTLQQFTNNKPMLRAAVARLRVFPDTVRDTDQPPMPAFVAVRILNNDTQAGEFYVDKILEGYNSKKAVTMNRHAAMEMVKGRANNIVSGMANSTKGTLSSLEKLLLTTTQYRGRKIVFLISDGFYLESKNTYYTTTDRLERAINLATRSGSSIYTIDARGLFSLVGSDATGERPFDPQGRLDKGAIGEAAASQEGLATLANETGGRFLKNQNYFDKWVDRVIDENSSYYVLAWTPEKDEQLSRKFKSIDVEITGRPDLKVRQQRGYLTVWDKSESKTRDAAAKDTGSKYKLPVLLSLSYLDVPNVGGVLNSSVQVVTDGLNYGEKEDQPALIDLQGVILDQEGKQAGTFKTGLTINPPPPGAAPAAGQSVIYNEKTPLKPGVYQVAVKITDGKSGDAGLVNQWIEIPDLSKNQLTMGSLFLGGKVIGSAAAPGNTGAQIQFSVDHRFGRPISLDFMSFVYNAARAGNGAGEVNLATRIEVFSSDGQTVIDTNLRPLATKGNADLARIPVRGSIKQQVISPGSYLLRVTVADNIANTKAVQQAFFTIE